MFINSIKFLKSIVKKTSNATEKMSKRFKQSFPKMKKNLSVNIPKET